MSDVGLGANLELNITEALRRVDQLGRALDQASGVTITVDTSGVAPEITRAVDAAQTEVTVEADTTTVSPEISRAVEAADSGITVEADTSDVAPSITGAVDAADAEVTVTGDAAEVTGSIDAAVEAANTEVVVEADAADVTGSITGAIEAANTRVTVTGDASELTGDVTAAIDAADTNIAVTGGVDEGLQTDVLNLGANIADATEEGKGLGRVLGLLSVGAGLAALRSLADSASDLAESTSKAGVVFGNEFPRIERFATGAADAVGLSTQAALEATATFGNLFQALGTSREEAARLSPEVVQLAGDLASFNNLGVDETLEKLRSGLVGEIEPLRSLGVSFNALQVDAKATELGLGGVGRELTEGEKVQARYALIVEQTTLAQGDFARTSDGLANQQRILKAEFENAAAAAGTALLPAFQAIIVEVRRALPGLQQVAEDVLPAVGDALANLAPLLGVTTDLLVALSPAIVLVADVLASIPDEAIAVGAALLIANRAFGGLTGLVSGLGGALRIVPQLLAGTASATSAAAGSVGPLANGVTKLASSLGALGPAGVVAAAVGGALFLKWQEGQAEARRFREEVDQLTEAWTNQDGQVRISTEGTERYIETQSRFDARSQLDDLDRLGLSYAETGRLAEDGSEGLEQFRSRALATGEIVEVFAGQHNQLVDAQGRVVGTLGDMSSEFGKVTASGDRLFAGNTDLIKSFEELQRVQAATAEAQVTTAVAAGKATQAQVDHAVALATAADGTVDYVEALRILGPALDRQAAAAERTLATFGPLADQYVATGEALTNLRDAAPGVASQIAAIRSGVSGSDRDFLALAVGLDAAALSEEDFADAAALLGTDVESLKGFVEDANKAVTDFASTATDALPTVSDAFRDLNDDGKVSANEFRINLETQAQDVRDFTFRLAALTQAGFGELAGVIAQEGPELGGALAAELAAALASGNTEMIQATQDSLDLFQGSWEDSTAFLRDTLGPEFVLTTGLIGSAATTTFGENLDFGERLRIAGEIAQLQMDESGKAVAAIAATEGAEAARLYGEALKLDEETIDAAVAAGVAITANAPTGAATTAGTRTGEAFADGLAVGMTNRQILVNDRAQQLVLQARAAAARAAQEGSPSKLFATLGENMALGVVMGLNTAGDQVVAAAEQIVRDAAVGVAQVSPEVALAATPGGGVNPAGSTDAGALQVTFDVTVNPPTGMSPDEAADIGAAIVDGAAERLAERRLSIVARTQ